MATKQILYNSENYNESFSDFKTTQYFNKYISLLHQYLLHINENIYVQDKEYQLFIIKRGIDTISHIFLTLLMYTRNLDLTYHHVEKAYCYYVEFISQISEESHSFLKLNSKDAALFVYKKTVFDINQEYRKNFEQVEEEEELMTCLQKHIRYYNEFIMYILYNNHECIKDSNDNTLYQTIFFVIKYGSLTAEYVHDTTDNDTILTELFHLISIVTYYLHKEKVHNDKIISVCQTIVKKYITTTSCSIDSIYKNLMNENLKEVLDFTPIKIVNWITK